ncbi:LLM class flavin-dependent oxidoreductase [Gordonia sp. DT30]|uniref:LLM class flavin-dependent oxidoreductase n=1 Tax=unclassified Gordonia (in: high G+C Gram-positive bacteria) TaxID=2657482 RepID=UPI003CF83F8A
MKFGLGVPTGTEGLMYPVPYADPDQAVRLAVSAERLGFDSVWANDHVNTPHYVRSEFPDPPRFYDPYVYLSFVAAQTTTLEVATAVSVMSFRHPVVVAKQAATLDQYSGGRFRLGLGLGAYRQETESMWPGRVIHRGDHADEFMQSIQLLTTERRASFEGKYISFDDVESFPHPVRKPFPILSGGNSPGARERAGKYATGWIPGMLTPQEIIDGLAEIRQIADGAGRTLPDDFDVAPQLTVSIAPTHAEALEKFQRSQLFTHVGSLSKSTLKNQQSEWAARSLIGTPEEVLDMVRSYADAGVSTFSGLLFACNTVEETLDAMHDFAENVIAPYRKEKQQVEVPA